VRKKSKTPNEKSANHPMRKGKTRQRESRKKFAGRKIKLNKVWKQGGKFTNERRGTKKKGENVRTVVGTVRPDRGAIRQIQD